MHEELLHSNDQRTIMTTYAPSITREQRASTITHFQTYAGFGIALTHVHCIYSLFWHQHLMSTRSHDECVSLPLYIIQTQPWWWSHNVPAITVSWTSDQRRTFKSLF